jgi:hypothetical protein
MKRRIGVDTVQKGCPLFKWPLIVLSSFILTAAGTAAPEDDNDGDGLIEAIDPNDSDSQNWSPYNSRPWYTDGSNSGPFGDDDADGIQNYWDWLPDDSDNDNDGDTLTIDVDPNDNDGSNYSSANFQNWGPYVFGDNDGDGIANYWDAYPDGAPPGSSDTDGDGFLDEIDPASGDAYNYSLYNGETWYGDIFGDLDSDGYLNFWDETPFGY